MSVVRAVRQATARPTNEDQARGVAGVERLFAKILEGGLDALVVQLLILGTELITPTGAAMEELGHHTQRRMRLALDPRRAADIGRAVELSRNVTHLLAALLAGAAAATAGARRVGVWRVSRRR